MKNRKTFREGVDCFHVAEDRNEWKACRTLTNSRFSSQERNSISGWTTLRWVSQEAQCRIVFICHAAFTQLVTKYACALLDLIPNQVTCLKPTYLSKKPFNIILQYWRLGLSSSPSHDVLAKLSEILTVTPPAALSHTQLRCYRKSYTLD